MIKTRKFLPALLPAMALTPVAVGSVTLGVAASLSAPAVAQTAPTGDLLLVQRHLESMNTLTANFTQTDRRGQVQSGTLTMKQPGRIRFQYGQGNSLLIVSDGRSLNMIDYEVRQVQRWPIRNSPLAVLIDPGANLMRYAQLNDTGNPSTISVAVRDPRRPEYGMITMIFERDASAPAGLRLYGWEALDAQRNRTTIRLTNQRYNVAVADSAFNWTDPRTRNRR